MGWTTSAIQHSKRDGRKDDEFQWGRVLFEVPVRYQSGDAQQATRYPVLKFRGEIWDGGDDLGATLSTMIMVGQEGG